MKQPKTKINFDPHTYSIKELKLLKKYLERYIKHWTAP